MKKMCLAFIALMWTLFSLNQAAALEWSFDTDPTGQIPEGWTYGNHGANAFVEVDDTVYYGSSGKSVHFDDTSTAQTAVITYTLGHYTSIVLEYYMLTTNSSYYSAAPDLIGDMGNSYHLQFRGDGSGYMGIAGDYGYIEPEFLPYTVGNWYYFRRELTLFGDGTSSGSFYAEEVGNPSNRNSYNIGSLRPNTYIDRIEIGTPLTTWSDTFIDNITIEPVPVPATLLLLGSALVGLAGFRRKWATRGGGE